MTGASRELWKLWTDFRNLRNENDLIKRQKRIDKFNNLTEIFIQRSFVKEIQPFPDDKGGHFVGLRHLIGFENDSTGTGGEKMSTSG